MAKYSEARFWDLSPSALLFGKNTAISKTDFKRTPQELANRQKIPSNITFVIYDEFENKVEELKVQTVPMKLELAGDSSWDVIPSVGRNNPFYHYTGGEDSLSFTLDWYSNGPQGKLRTDVIRKCRWVRSLSKADGYRSEPPIVVLVFGNLFTDEQWIVESAPYSLELFDKEMNMLPRQAYQQVTLKRISGYNLTRDEQRYVNSSPPSSPDDPGFNGYPLG